jgi:hypothetical protein
VAVGAEEQGSALDRDTIRTTLLYFNSHSEQLGRSLLAAPTSNVHRTITACSFIIRGKNLFGDRSMASVTISPPTTNKHLIRWVEKMADLTQPDRIHWIDGSQAEYDFLCDQLVKAGTFT